MADSAVFDIEIQDSNEHGQRLYEDEEVEIGEEVIEVSMTKSFSVYISTCVSKLARLHLC